MGMTFLGDEESYRWSGARLVITRLSPMKW
jgi:hypothetical protein